MNALQTQPFYTVLKNSIFSVLFVSFLVSLNFTLHAQQSFAKIEKNMNAQAKSLIHVLNTTKDTLILKSDKKIQALYTVNDNPSSELDLRIDNTTYKLPLVGLNKGRHLFVAIQSPNHIVFVVEILKDSTLFDKLNLVTYKTPKNEIVANTTPIPY